MTNREIRRIAMEQSALECNCKAEDFEKKETVLCVSRPCEKARAGMPLPLYLNIVSYGGNLVISGNEKILEKVKVYVEKQEIFHAFETPFIYGLNELLNEAGYKICFMPEYFLPDVENLKTYTCPYETRVLYPEELEAHYLPAFGNALCKERKQLDKIAVGAFDGDKLAGLAGASADCEKMWQIGIDVLPEYRGKGISKAITCRLTEEVLKLGKVPFYCAAWSNIRSVRNALSCGYKPAWTELAAREKDFVSKAAQ